MKKTTNINLKKGEIRLKELSEYLRVGLSTAAKRRDEIADHFNLPSKKLLWFHVYKLS